MKILLANTSAYPMIGGVENSLRFIGRELRSAGHEVKIFCLQTSPDQPLRMEHEGIEIIRAPYTPRRWPHTRLRSIVRATKQSIPSLLNEFKPEAIWSRSASVGLGIRRGGFQGPLLQIFPTNAKMNCRGLYIQNHGLPISRRLMLLGLWSLDYFVSAWFERKLARQCSAVTFSKNMRSQLLAGFPKDARSCHVIPPGVDSLFFSPENGYRYFQQIEQQYGLHRNDDIVLYVGRLSNAKHIPMLMDSVSILGKPVKLVLVGQGSDEPRLRNYAQRIGINDRLVFAGTHHEMLPGFYAMSRVCVLPTTIESFGQVFLESLACGTPAVGFAGDGRCVLTATQEIIRDEETGAIAREVSAQNLAEKINLILSLDNESYALMSQCARNDVRQCFSWRRFVEEALKLSGSEGFENGGKAAS